MSREFHGDHGNAETTTHFYRHSAAHRDHVRLVELVKEQVRHAYSLGYRQGKRTAVNTRKKPAPLSGHSR
jgi:hypothetical protein